MDPFEPKVSVLLPAFDAATTLPTCLRSLQRQTESAWECVLVDDGSRDETPTIARAFAHRDARIRVLRTPHRGIVEALMHGLDECRAPVVARMDADDWMHRDRLACQLGALDADPALDGLGARVRIFPRDGLTPGRRAYERWLNGIDTVTSVRDEAFVECPIAHPSLCIRTHVLRRHGYRERGWAEDYDLLLRLLESGHRLAVHPRRLLGWRDTPGRVSRTRPAYALDRFTACKAEFLARGLLADTQAYVLWGYGDTGRSLRGALLRHDREPTRIVELHPGRLGQRIHGAEVVPPEALADGPKLPIVVSVSGASPRAQIREALARMGFRERRDFICAA